MIILKLFGRCKIHYYNMKNLAVDKCLSALQILILDMGGKTFSEWL